VFFNLFFFANFDHPTIICKLFLHLSSNCVVLHKIGNVCNKYVYLQCFTMKTSIVLNYHLIIIVNFDNFTFCGTILSNDVVETLNWFLFSFK